MQYILTLHPLESYKGSNLWTTIKIPHTYLKGTLSFKIAELHQRHDAVFRIGPMNCPTHEKMLGKIFAGVVQETLSSLKT